MKENVLEVLMYLFENYYINGGMTGDVDDSPDFPPDQATLTSELTEAGFARGEISKAFSWLEALTRVQPGASDLISAGRGGIRHYSFAERKKLDEHCRGFLLQLESTGVLDATARELVLERVLALDTDELSLEQLKWVTWMVLFHRSGQEFAHGLLEELVFDAHAGQLH